MLPSTGDITASTFIFRMNQTNKFLYGINSKVEIGEKKKLESISTCCNCVQIHYLQNLEFVVAKWHCFQTEPRESFQTKNLLSSSLAKHSAE